KPSRPSEPSRTVKPAVAGEAVVSVRPAKADEQPWREFALAKSGAAVWSPGDLKSGKARVLKTASARVEYHPFNLVAKDEVFEAAWADCPNAAGSDPKALLAENRDAWVQAGGGKLVNDESIDLKGNP